MPAYSHVKVLISSAALLLGSCPCAVFPVVSVWTNAARCPTLSDKTFIPAEIEGSCHQVQPVAETYALQPFYWLKLSSFLDSNF